MVILLSGKARSGKDSMADHIVKKYNGEKLWFAKKLKDICAEHFGLNHDECYDHKTEFSRRVLQGIGKMFRDEIDKNYWINIVVSQSREILTKDPKKLIVISDTRYRNEVEVMKQNFDKCVVFRVIRDSAPKIEYGADHDSENDLNDFKFDFEIENLNTLVDLYEKVDSVLGELKNG